MSTPEQPEHPGLTRKQLREIRMTGATPIVTADDAPAVDGTLEQEAPTRETTAPASPDEAAPDDAPEAEAPAPETGTPVEPPAPAVPLPRAAVPVVAAPLPTPDAQVDLGVSPLTRRQAREQERIRTASVPVITPDIAAAPAGSEWAPPVPASVASEEVPTESPAPAPAVEDVVEEAAADDSAEDAVASVVETEQPVEEPAVEQAAAESAATAEGAAAEAPADEPVEEDAEEERAVLRPEFGSALLAGAGEAGSLPPSFDDLIARGASSTGSLATPNALILSQSPTAGPLTSPVTATGEVLITGTFNLPEGLGSQGHAHGTADGKEADSVLIDGELPPASSPTPIAASAAISTVKGTGEIIRPPAPEKGNKLMLSLAITAGVLAVALVGVLILAFVTGVF